MTFKKLAKKSAKELTSWEDLCRLMKNWLWLSEILKNSSDKDLVDFAKGSDRDFITLYRHREFMIGKIK